MSDKDAAIKIAAIKILVECCGASLCKHILTESFSYSHINQFSKQVNKQKWRLDERLGANKIRTKCILYELVV